MEIITTSTVSSTSIHEMRKTARWRRRGIIVNDDGCDIADTPEELLDKFLRHQLGTQVDTIFYCTTGSGTSFTHNTKAGDFYGEQWYSTPSEWALSLHDSAKALIEQGRDCLHVVVDFAHENGLEVFWSLRMNDVHDASPERYSLSRFKLDHPEWLMGEVGKEYTDYRTEDLWRSTALNYAIDEVRENRFRLIEEVCENYDVDGVEMDFGRMPFLFKPGEVEKNMDLMTDFVRRVRARMDEIGEKRDRPILLAARVPATVELCRKIGLDIETYLKEGLIDVLIAGFGYTPFLIPAEELINLGHQYDVPVYPCICNEPRLGDAATCTEQFRAAATNFWDAGADGIYIFNANYYSNRQGQMVMGFGPPYCRFNDIGDLGTLARKDKLYLVTLGVEPHVSMDGACLSLPLPLVLPQVFPGTGGVMRTLNITVGDDVEELSSQGLISEMNLRLRFKGLTDGDEVSVKLNGEALKDGEIIKEGGDSWIEYVLTAPPLKKGGNSLEITRKYLESAVKQLTLNFVELWVRYKKS